MLPVDLVILPYQYSIVDWEFANLPDKWVRNLGNLWPGKAGLVREDAVERARQFFDSGLEIRGLERQLLFPESSLFGGESWGSMIDSWLFNCSR